MNLPSSNQPRFVCRCVRLARTVSADAFARHLARCEDCQQAFAVEDEFDALLRRDAARLPQPDLAGLENSIISAVRVSRRAPASVARISPWTWLGAVLAAAAAVVVTLNFRPAAPQPQSQPVVARAATVEAFAPSEVVGKISDELFDRVQPAAQFLQQDPLQREIESIRADARSALNFLALNFLPTPREAIAGEPRTI